MNARIKQQRSRFSQDAKKLKTVLINKRKSLLWKLKSQSSFIQSNKKLHVKEDVDVKELLPPKLQKFKNSKRYTELKFKCRREAVPMKLRAFPRSFWEQPNKLNLISPASVYYVTDETSSAEHGDPIEEFAQRNSPEIVGEPNIDLLFSLFRNVELEQRKACGYKNNTLVRRGRPKVSKTKLRTVRDDDPYLTSSAAESLLPYVPKRRKELDNVHYEITSDHQILSRVSVEHSDSTLLSSVHTRNQNYSQILSELVIQL